MFRKFMLPLAAILTLGSSFVLLPAQARADHYRREHREWHRREYREAPAPELRRVVWQYSGGFFKDAGNGRWEEQNASGQYNFQESRRTREFVELFDASRGLTARLYNNAMYLQGGDRPVFSKLYDGEWTE
jgi:hypothetical protein